MVRNRTLLCDMRFILAVLRRITSPPQQPPPRSAFCLSGKLWSRSVKLAYTLLNKLGTKNEQILKPGDKARERAHNVHDKLRQTGILRFAATRC